MPPAIRKRLCADAGTLGPPRLSAARRDPPLCKHAVESVNMRQAPLSPREGGGTHRVAKSKVWCGPGTHGEPRALHVPCVLRLGFRRRSVRLLSSAQGLFEPIGDARGCQRIFPASNEACVGTPCPTNATCDTRHACGPWLMMAKMAGPGDGDAPVPPGMPENERPSRANAIRTLLKRRLGKKIESVDDSDKARGNMHAQLISHVSGSPCPPSASHQ